MATGTRSGAFRRYLNDTSPSWELGRELARSQVDYKTPGWRTVWQLDRRPGATERQVICYVLTELSDSGGRGLSLREAGDLIIPIGEGLIDAASLVPMRDIITGATPVDHHRPRVFKSSGMSWEDLVVAAEVYHAD